MPTLMSGVALRPQSRMGAAGHRTLHPVSQPIDGGGPETRLELAVLISLARYLRIPGHSIWNIPFYSFYFLLSSSSDVQQNFPGLDRKPALVELLFCLNVREPLPVAERCCGLSCALSPGLKARCSGFR